MPQKKLDLIPIEEPKKLDLTPLDLTPIEEEPEEIKVEPKPKKVIPFFERAANLAMTGPNDPVSMIHKGFELFRPQIESRLGQITEQEPGILNPNVEQNPLIAKSFLPETDAESPYTLSGLITGQKKPLWQRGLEGARHALYEGVVRPMASPAGIAGMIEGGNPANIAEESLSKSGMNIAKDVATKSKPKVKLNPDGTFTNVTTGEVLDKSGNTIKDVIRDASGREIAPAQTIIPDRPAGPWDTNARNNVVPPVQTPVDKLLAALSETKPLNKEQAKIYSQERAQRVGEAEGVKTKGLAGHFERLGKLKGEHTKLQTEPLKLEPPDVDELVNTIESFPDFLRYDKTNATVGLTKILQGKIPQESEVKLLERVFGPEFSTQVRARLPKIDTRRSLISEAVNLPRAIQSSFDLSYPFRQGLGLIHTKGWWTSWKDMVNSYGSRKVYDGVNESILEHPNFIQPRINGELKPSLAQRAGLKLTDLLNEREEPFQSTLAENIPGIGHAVKASNRAYVAFGNKIKSDTFNSLIDQADKIYQTAKATGSARRGFLKESFSDPEILNPRTNIDLAKKIADFVNNASGRGKLPGKLERSAEALNGAFFSPRLIASRLQYMNPSNYIFADPFIRKQYLKSLLAMAGTWTTIAGVAKAAGADVSLDADNADFGKIKIGNTRLDPAGGFQQYLVLAHRLASGRYVTSTSGKEHEMGARFGDKTRVDSLVDFVSNKLAPVPSYAWNIGDATVNRPFEMGDRTIRMFTPMVIQDLSEILQEDPNLLPMMIPAITGMGTQTYGKESSNRFLPEEVFPRESDIRFPLKR